MKYRVEILPTAWEDLKRIEDYYLLQFENVEVAMQVSDSILDCIEKLEDFPDLGSITPDTWLNEKRFRMLICKKHVAIYKQIENVVYIYHIADTQSEYTKLFH